MIQIASPQLGKEERDAVDRVLRSGIIAQGPEVAKFEEEFAKMCGGNMQLLHVMELQQVT